ncbi:bifunctional DNA-formamidopyrimidine glycosylase/DNA-(apurinic or apyrimidinic site) lyase [Haloferula sargassicola]|uniref:Formamidopyrimidine-DNA glycosylase n=1 Tax=Haloferula sargassicola TaxID=490096 RepID=A0ABP9UT09_9BACT
MPELPEVETTLRGIAPHLLGRRFEDILVRERRLRQPVPADLDPLCGTPVTSLTRRAKYLILGFGNGEHLLVHLGMTGSLRICNADFELRKHDHVVFLLDDGRQVRFHDPRRFGIVLPIGNADPSGHPLLRGLGPEPLGPGFAADHLYDACRSRKAAIKLVIMDGKVVVGVGNIYASEALFRAGIRPGTAARRVSRPRLARLVEGIRAVLAESIEQGGTTLRDFVNSSGEPGYFRQRLFVYERGGKPCRVCGTAIRQAIMGQRSTYWCSVCQK